MKVDILPPFGLYNPVLLHRHKGKLTFPLCCTCVEEQSALGMLERSYYCTHMESQRMLHGTWCTSEILKAVEMGYRVLHIHEVWHFPEDQRQTVSSPRTSTIGSRSNKKVVVGLVGRRGILKKKTSTFVTMRNERGSYLTGPRLPRILAARILPN